MPHEKINHIRSAAAPAPPAPPAPPGGTPMRERDQLIIGWNVAPEPWCQVSVAPDGWQTTGDWHIVTIDEAGVDRAIKALKKARRLMRRR